MSIVSAYVRENWGYTVEELRSIFLFNVESFSSMEEANRRLKRYIKELLGREILKTKRKSAEETNNVEFDNYSDDDLLSADAKYVFSFVGIIIFENIIAYVYPKYIGSTDALCALPPIKEMQQVMRVIEKYSKEKSKQNRKDIHLFADTDSSGKINTMSVILYYTNDIWS